MARRNRRKSVLSQPVAAHRVEDVPAEDLGLYVHSSLLHTAEDASPEWFEEESSPVDHGFDDDRAARESDEVPSDDEGLDKESLRQREAMILRAMAKTTLAEQQQLMGDLNTVRQTLAAIQQGEREVDLANAVVHAHLTPVMAHSFGLSGDTDWLDEIQVTAADANIEQTMTVEATLWYQGRDRDVLADAHEFRIQAEGAAHVLASQYGAQATRAARAFLDHIAHLHRFAADPDGSGVAESGLPHERTPSTDPEVFDNLQPAIAPENEAAHAEAEGDGSEDEMQMQGQRRTAAEWTCKYADEGGCSGNVQQISSRDGGTTYVCYGHEDRYWDERNSSTASRHTAASWSFERSMTHPSTGFQMYDIYAADDGRYAYVWNGPMVDNPRIVVYRSEGGIGQEEGQYPLEGDPLATLQAHASRRTAAPISDPQSTFTLNPDDEKWIGNFTDDAIAENIRFWSSDEGRNAQPYLEGYADAMLKHFNDELARRTGSRRKGARRDDSGGPEVFYVVTTEGELIDGPFTYQRAHEVRDAWGGNSTVTALGDARQRGWDTYSWPETREAARHEARSPKPPQLKKRKTDETNGAADLGLQRERSSEKADEKAKKKHRDENKKRMQQGKPPKLRDRKRDDSGRFASANRLIEWVSDNLSPAKRAQLEAMPLAHQASVVRKIVADVMADDSGASVSGLPQVEVMDALDELAEWEIEEVDSDNVNPKGQADVLPSSPQDLVSNARLAGFRQRIADNQRRVVPPFGREGSARTAMPNPVDLGVSVGDIFVSSWGYDQTNIDFYEVTRLTGASVEVRKIGKDYVEQNGPGGDKVMPRKGAFIGEPMVKRIQGSGGGDRWGAYFNVNSYATAFLWDGKPEYQTDSQFGH